jgi:hypothetical protein
MDITNAKGDLVIKNGIVDMKDLSVTILGGQFVINGQYNTFTPQKPAFDFAMKIKRLSFKKSYNAFNTVQRMAPMAKNVDGMFSTDFKMSGPLDAELMPVYEKITGLGDLFIEDAKLKDLKVLRKITEATKLSQTDELRIKNTTIKGKIEDGKIIFEPFTVPSGSANITMGGSRSLDSILDMDVSIDMPSGQAGEAMKSALSKYGVGDMIGDRITIPLKITGNESNPKVKVLGGKSSGSKSTPKEVVGKKLKDEVDKNKAEQKAKILADAQVQADRLKAEGKIQGKRLKDEAYKQAKDLESKASTPWEKPAAKIAGDKIRKEGVSKENKIINEANSQADRVMTEARNKASKI